MRLMKPIRCVYCFPSVDTSFLDYPKWKHLIPESLTADQFNEAWVNYFGYRFDECAVERNPGGLIIFTPNEIIMSGGFVDHTETPLLAEDQTFYSYGGCDWCVDQLGDRFYFINPETNLPLNWDKVRALHTIMRYEPFKIIAL